MKLKNKYYFEFAMNFKKDYDVNLLENLLKLKASKLVKLKDSKGIEKTAKFIYKTEELNEIYTDFEFKKFVKEHFENLLGLKDILNENDGDLTFFIVFTELQDKPIIGFDKETLHILSELNANFEVDYA